MRFARIPSVAKRRRVGNREWGGSGYRPEYQARKRGFSTARDTARPAAPQIQTGAGRVWGVFVASWPAPLLYTAPLRARMGGRWARVRKRRGGRASATLRGPETPRPLTGRYRRSNSDLMRNKVAAGARSAQPRTNSRAFRGISRNRKRPPARPRPPRPREAAGATIRVEEGSRSENLRLFSRRPHTLDPPGVRSGGIWSKGG